MKHWSEIDKARQEWVAVTLLTCVEMADKIIAEVERHKLPARVEQLGYDREALVAALEHLGYWVREGK